MGHKFILEEFSGFNHVIAVVWVAFKNTFIANFVLFFVTLGCTIYILIKQIIFYQKHLKIWV